MLLDQTVLIVGGSAGIGYAVAEAAADAGAHVIIAARDSARVAAAVARLGDGVRGETVDVRDEVSIRGLFARLGALDHVVVTTGFDHAATPVREADARVVEDLWRTKFLGQLLLAKHAAERLGERGSIVLTSGVLSVRPAAGWAALSATNAAVEALARTLALELAPRRVNVVVPGAVDTGKRFAGLTAPERAAKLQAGIGDKLPARRIGQPEDLAAAYLFALQNSFLTGQSLVVDGGAAVA